MDNLKHWQFLAAIIIVVCLIYIVGIERQKHKDEHEKAIIKQAIKECEK